MNIKKELEILQSDDKLMPKMYSFTEVQKLLKYQEEGFQSLLTASQMEMLEEIENYMKIKKGSRIDMKAGNDLIIIPAEFIESKQSQLKEREE